MSATIPRLPNDGNALPERSIRLGVVSDTHGHVGNASDAVRMLESLDVTVVVHCGDIGTVEIVPLWQQWPTHFVYGNVDHERPLASAIQAAGQHDHGRFGSLELAGRRIAFLHGDDFELLEATITDGRYDVVCHGHTHEVRAEHVGRTLVLNPGALYRARQHTLAIVDFPGLEVNVVAV